MGDIPCDLSLHRIPGVLNIMEKIELKKEKKKEKVEEDKLDNKRGDSILNIKG